MALFQTLSRKAVQEVESLTEGQLHKPDLEQWAEALVEKYSLEPITLLEDGIKLNGHGPSDIDVSQDPRLAIQNREQPVYAEGTFYTIAVPFTGDPVILRSHPSIQGADPIPPLGEVAGGEILVTYQGVGLDAKKVRAEFDKNLKSIRWFLKYGEPEIKNHNENLQRLVLDRIAARQNKLLRDRRTAEAIGFPIQERANAPQVYTVPVQRKKVSIVQCAPLGLSRPADHILYLAAYESILQTLWSMGRVLELNPKAFSTMGEEALRFVFLVPLNINYEGQATGETFNFEGKTDILIKAGGRNVFIAECLVWDGAEYFKTKIDQLLGYTSWRDTRTAIIVFNRKKNLSGVLAQIPDLVKAHSNFKRHDTSYTHETGYRFVLHHRDDTDRELTLTVLVFDVPA